MPQKINDKWEFTDEELDIMMKTAEENHVKNNDHRPKDATMQAFERIMTEELGVEIVDVTPERS